MRTQIRSLAAKAAAALAFAALGGMSTGAQASFMAYICDTASCSGTAGVDYLIVTDNGVGDSNPLLGVITEAFSFGGLTALVNTSLSKPEVGSAADPVLDITFTISGTGSVWMYASDTGYTGTGVITGSVDGNSTSIEFVDIGIFGANNNTNPPAGGTPGATLCIAPPVAGSPYHTSCTTGPVGLVTNPYQLTIGLAVDNTTRGLTTGDFNTHLPEPATLALLGTGILGLAWFRRRRRT